MPQKQCEKCGELVDDAKAFCPGCGAALVAEEQRESASNFDSMDSTVQFGQTMYNQMLSDMGLNIKGEPPAPASIQAEPERKMEIVIEPAAAPSPRPAQSATTPIPTESKSSRKWWIIGAILVVGVFLAFVVIAVAAYLIWPRIAG